jgi:hypothetical protein
MTVVGTWSGNLEILAAAALLCEVETPSVVMSSVAMRVQCLLKTTNCAVFQVFNRFLLLLPLLLLLQCAKLRHDLEALLKALMCANRAPVAIERDDQVERTPDRNFVRMNAYVRSRCLADSRSVCETDKKARKEDNQVKKIKLIATMDPGTQASPFSSPPSFSFSSGCADQI